MTAVGKNTAAKKAIKKDIEEINFREVAQDVIKKYFDKGMILDGVLWGRIIGLYEKVLNRPQPMQPSRFCGLQAATIIVRASGPTPS
jgi:hypothetical protein